MQKRPVVHKFQLFGLLVAATLLSVACASTTVLPAAKVEPTAVTETAVATPETGQWKQYSSKKYGFEFRYPESCNISEQDESLNVGGRIELSILESSGLGLDEYVTRFVDSRTKNNGWTVESIEDGSIGGHEAKTVDYRFGGQTRFGTATFAIRGDKAYIWGFTAGGFTCDELNVYDPLLASFRFAN